jgi:exodeoxyribonuclease VII small subunit
MMPDRKPADLPGNLNGLSYEQAFDALASILEQLEDARLPLSEAIALYERGRALAAYCTTLLDAAELRLETAE